MKYILFFLSLSLVSFPAHGLAESINVHNQTLQATYDDTQNELSVSTYPQATVFIQGGKLSISGSSQTTTETDPVYGQGHAIVVTDHAGQAVRIIAFPNLPFILIRETLKNAETHDQVLNKVPILMFEPKIAGDPKDLKVRGTGGLSSAEQPGGGSYEWLAVADAPSRHGLLAAWISQFRATGVCEPHQDKGKLRVEVRTEFGRLRLSAGETAQTETLALGYFDDIRLGLEAWADQVAQTYDVRLPAQPAGYCTWYSDAHGGSSDEKNLAILADFVSVNLKQYGLSFIQIDDGWQLGDSHGNGSNKNFAQFNPHGPYASGMKQTAEHIRSDGLVPGVWFMPFAGSYNDEWFKDKQDLFVKRSDGKPYDTDWGGTCLDMTNPAAQKYVHDVVSNIAHNWGYTYFKLDGFWTGLAAKQIYVNSDYKEDGFGDAVLSNPNKTNVEALRDGMKVVRQAAGPGVFFLGCNVAQNMRTYGGSFGTLDAMRIGPDNGGDWNAWRGASPLFGSRSYFLNGRVWYNDPDPNYVRPRMSLDEARTAACWTSISGQLYTNGDWIPGLPADRLEIIRRTAEPHGKVSRPVDFLENDPPRIWHVIDAKGTTRRDVIAIYNWTDAPQQISVPLAPLDLPKADHYAAFDFWANAFLPPVHDVLSSTLPPHACQIIALRGIADHPVLLSTSRHITQGMIDVSDELWNPATLTLSGTSRIIGNDPYELRVAAPDSTRWKIDHAELDKASQDAGVTVKVNAGADLRATLQCPKDGSISWRLIFKHQ